MTEQENIKLPKSFFDKLNAHALDKNDALTAENAKTDAPGAPNLTTRDQARAYTQGFITAFPDLHWEVPVFVAQGDYVVLNWVGTGTHRGPLTTPLRCHHPTHRQEGDRAGQYHFGDQGRKGKTHLDLLGYGCLLGQLGLMPPL